MLIAALLVFFSMGSGANPMLQTLEQMESRVASVDFKEPIRTDVLNVIDKMKNTTQLFANSDKDRNDIMAQYLEKEDLSDNDLQQQLELSHLHRGEYQDKMLALRFELKNMISEPQWKAIMEAAPSK